MRDLVEKLSTLTELHDEVDGSGSEKNFSQLNNIRMVHLLNYNNDHQNRGRAGGREGKRGRGIRTEI